VGLARSKVELHHLAALLGEVEGVQIDTEDCRAAMMIASAGSIRSSARAFFQITDKPLLLDLAVRRRSTFGAKFEIAAVSEQKACTSACDPFRSSGDEPPMARFEPTETWAVLAYCSTMPNPCTAFGWLQFLLNPHGAREPASLTRVKHPQLGNAIVSAPEPSTKLAVDILHHHHIRVDVGLVVRVEFSGRELVQHDWALRDHGG
jgi:hypothetical protein